MKAPAAYSFFETGIGRCAIAWRGARVCGIALPDRDDDATIAALRRGSGDLAPGDPPPIISEAIARIRDLLAGQRIDLTDIPLDLDAASPFECDVYAETLKIPAGATCTYGEIARALGDPHAAQAVGRALGRNPIPIIVPCHRVLAAGGKLGGFSAPRGNTAKRELLAIEKADPPDGPMLFSAWG